MPDLPRGGQEVPRGAERLRRLPPQGRQAQGRARPEVRGLPHREPTGRTRASTTRKTRFALTGKHIRQRVQGLPREQRLQGRAADLRRLPPQGRQAASGPARRQVRGLPHGDGLEATSRPSSTTATPGTRCAASTCAAKCETCHTAAPARREDADDLHRLPPEGRQAQRDARHGLRRLPHRAQLARGASTTTTCRSSSCAASTRRRVQGLPPRPEELQGNGAPTCIGCHRKDDTHKDAVRRQVRQLPHRQVAGATSSSATSATRSTRCSASTPPTKCDSCHTGHAYQDKLATDCFSLPRQGRQASRPARPAVRAVPRDGRLEEDRCASTTTSRASRWSGATRASSARRATDARVQGRAARSASPATRRTTSTS